MRRPVSFGRFAAATLSAALVVGAPVWWAMGTAQAAPAAASFTPGLALLDASGRTPGGAEPSIAVDRKGNVYVSAPVGVPSGGCPFWTIHPGTLNDKGLPYEYNGTTDTDHGSVGGGDCDISIGPNADAVNQARYDDVSVSSLSLANLTTNNSTDGGKTFRTPANTVGTQVFGVDRQWQAADFGLPGLPGPGLSGFGVHYLTVHDLATTNIVVAVSTDGGYAFTSNSTAIDAEHQGTATGNNGNHFGTVVVNPATHKLYIPFIAPASPTDSVNHVVYIAEGTPDVTNPLAPISWKNYTVYAGPPNQSLDHIFPAIAIDGVGTVYVAWAGDTGSSATNRVQLSRMSTPNDASRWTAPAYVDSGGSHSNMFPWLIAGKAPGVVDVAWYAGSLVGSGGACPAGQSGTAGDGDGVNNNCFNQWAVQFAQSIDTGASFTVSPASGTIHKGSICDQGTACLAIGGDRTLLDFFDIDLDPAGGANIAYSSDVTSPGTSTVYYTRQCTGVSALDGSPLSRDCGALVPPPVPGPAYLCDGSKLVPDPAGDAVNPTGGGGTNSVDITNVAFANAGADIDVTMSLANFTQLPPPGTTMSDYYVTWVAPDGKRYGVEHVEPAAGPASGYFVGEFDPARNRLKSGTTSPITGSVTTGTDGTIIWHVPKAKVGNPTVPVDAASGLTPAVSAPYAVVIVGEGVLGAGLVYTEPADRAPSAGFGPAWSVCGPAVVVTPTPTATGTASPTATGTASPTATGTASPTATGTASPTATGTASPTATGTASPTATASPTPTLTATPAATATAPPAASPTATATSSASPAGQGRYVPLAAATRALDTRNTTVKRRDGVSIVDLSGLLPASASAAVLNVTVADGTAAGYVTVYAAGEATPATSSVNFRAGQQQANEVISRVSAGRKVALEVGSNPRRPAQVALIVDVVGYFTQDPSANAGRVTPVTPRRLYDSGGSTRRGETTIDLSSVADVATSVVLNVTVDRPDAPGYVVVFPTGSTRPGTSNVNFARGQQQANEVITKLGDGQRVSLALDGRVPPGARLVVDLVGLIGPQSSRGSLTFTPLSAPIRAVDSRPGPYQAGVPPGRRNGPVTFTLPSGVPANARAVVLNVTTTAASATGFVTVYPGGAAHPGTSNVNFSAAGDQANAVVTALGPNRTVTVDVGGAGAPVTHLVVDVTGYLTG